MDKLLASILASLALAATWAATPDTAFLDEEKAWRQRRHDRLMSENGWLTLVGLHWLEPGENAFGSDPKCQVPLPEGKAPARAGTFTLKDGKVGVSAAADSGVKLRDEPVGTRELKTDAEGEPDVLELGDLRFHAIKRGE